jgi:hypothetical protein
MPLGGFYPFLGTKKLMVMVLVKKRQNIFYPEKRIKFGVFTVIGIGVRVSDANEVRYVSKAKTPKTLISHRSVTMMDFTTNTTARWQQ